MKPYNGSVGVIATTRCDGDGNNERNVDWCRYTAEMQLIEPDYEVPFSAASIEEAMQETLSTRDLFIAYLPLDFYTMPLWPKKRKQWTTAYEGIFYYCVDCKKPCNCGAQVCMEFFLPALMDPSNHISYNDDDDMYPWSWLPRLRCLRCVTLAGDADMRSLTYFPHPIFLEKIIGAEISKALTQLNSSRLKQKNDREKHKSCQVCDRPMLKTKSRRKKKSRKKAGKDPFIGLLYCSEECKQHYDFMRHMVDESKVTIDRGTTGLFQLFELFDTFKECQIDINKAMSWTSVCNRHRVHLKPCKKPGNEHLICNGCHRVVYCSKRCRNIDARGNAHICKRNWDQVFENQIVILQD